MAFGGADLFTKSSGYKQGPDTEGIYTEMALKQKGYTQRGPDTKNICKKPQSIAHLHKKGPKQNKSTNKAQAQNNLARECPNTEDT